MLYNPFSGYGLPVSPEDFCGRKYVVREIFNRISKGVPTSIVGERRTGKTSLLLFLKSQIASQKFNLEPDKNLFVYVDFLEFFERHGEPDRRKFWLFVLENMREVSFGKPWLEFLEQLIIKVHSDNTSNPYMDVKELLKMIRMYGFQPILLIDEFEVIAKKGKLDSDFFDGLRPLLSSKLLVFIISTRNYLSLVRKEDVFGSPFFNVFATKALNEFSESEFDEWMNNKLSKTDIHFDSSTVELILDLSGRHPFFSEIASNHAFYAYLDHHGPLLNENIVKQIKEKFYIDAKPNFDDYWNYCSDGEKINLAVLALRPKNKRIEIDNEEIKSLRMRSLISEDHRVFSSLFAEYIQNEVFRRTPQTFEDFRIKKLSEIPEARLRAIGSGMKEFIVKINDKYQMLFWEYIINNPQILESVIQKIVPKM